MVTVKARIEAIGMALFLGLTALPARASDESESATYAVSVRADAPVLALGAAAASAALVRNELSPAWCAPVCDKSAINPFDRPFAGYYRPTWARVSDVGVAALLVAPPLFLLLDEKLSPMLEDMVVIVEAIGLASASATLTSLAVRRPRPFLYSESAPLSERMSANGALSFFSGHTATAFAAATVLSETVRRRHPNEVGSWMVLGGSLALATLVGTGRILGGQHFPTDVLAGAAVGSSIGFLVPALHERGAQVTPMAAPGEVGVSILGAW